MEPDESDFDQLIAWLELQVRSQKRVRERVVAEPEPLQPTAKIIPFPLHRVRT
jgi:hypothetical protein